MQLSMLCHSEPKQDARARAALRTWSPLVALTSPCSSPHSRFPSWHPRLVAFWLPLSPVCSPLWTDM